jgi:hypothetical protein
VSPQAAWRRVLERRSLAAVLSAVAVWVVLVTLLHRGVDGPHRPAGAAEARTLEVGGLPVT